jgi:hypothetical protein
MYLACRPESTPHSSSSPFKHCGYGWGNSRGGAPWTRMEGQQAFFLVAVQALAAGGDGGGEAAGVHGWRSRGWLRRSGRNCSGGGANPRRPKSIQGMRSRFIPCFESANPLIHFPAIAPLPVLVLAKATSRQRLSRPKSKISVSPGRCLQHLRMHRCRFPPLRCPWLLCSRLHP